MYLRIQYFVYPPNTEDLPILTPVFAPSTAIPKIFFAPTTAPTPLPVFVSLNGFKYESQSGRNNYCGPTNFSMALTFWGWNGNRFVIGDALMPGNRLDKKGKAGDNDKNVMSYEFQDYIADNVSGISSVLRYGGDIDVLRHLIAGGFPVIVEKGIYELDMLGKVSWMGHYQFVTGYDEGKQEMIVQDSYRDGPDFHIGYDEFTNSWRAFNYAFLVVYPKERESEIVGLLGPLSDPVTAVHIALDRAKKESILLTGNDQFWATFNVGTSYVSLNEYEDAAVSYDNAFNLYSKLSTKITTRPYRVMWYQTDPYLAYYYSNRFSDVIRLANTTLNDTISKPILEESLLWRGHAYYMTGDTQSAIADYRAALKVHANWTPAKQALQNLGVQP